MSFCGLTYEKNISPYSLRSAKSEPRPTFCQMAVFRNLSNNNSDRP